jgi:WD40 repeat protein
VETNRLQLARQLDGAACLVVIDDVWNMDALEAFDCLSSAGRLLVTTRDVEIARERGPYVEIRQLASGQSRELLARWVDIEQKQLPRGADVLCDEVDHLALGVATVGALVAAGGGGAQWNAAWADVLTRLQAADLDKVGHKFSNYEYRTLLRAIDVSLDALSDEQQQRYHELAVFSGAAEVPRGAVEALWQPKGYTGTDCGELLGRLASRSLLRLSDQQHISLHDLQYDVATYYLRRRPEGLAGGHDQLLSGYRHRLSAHWGAPADEETIFADLAGELLRRSETDPLRRASVDGYFLDHLAFHLANAGQQKMLSALLISYDWLHLGVTVRDFAALLADFLHAPPDDDAISHVHGALQLASQFLAATAAALPAQLLGRLLGSTDIAVQSLLSTAAASRSGPWLRPRRGSLTPPGGPLQFLFTAHTAAVRAVAVSADGTRAITGANDGTARVWKLATGRCEHELPCGIDRVGAVAINADGTRAITSSGSNELTALVWNLTSGRREQELTGHLGYIQAVAMSADGARAITGSSDATARVWDLASGHCDHELAGHTGPVNAVAISPNGARAITGSTDATARVWDLASGHCDHTLTGHTRPVNAVAISPNGARAITGSSDVTARVWDLASGHCDHKLAEHAGPVIALAINADGTRAITGSTDATARVWDLTSGHCDHTLTGHTDSVGAVAISADGTRAITGSGAYLPQVLREGEYGDRFSYAIRRHGASSDRTARVWDLISGRCEHKLTGHIDAVYTVAISMDGTRAITGSGDHTARVWNLTSPPREHQLTGHTAAVAALAVSAGGSRALTGSDDHTARVWNLVSGRCEQVLTGHPGPVRAVAISADGTRAITGSVSTSDSHKDVAWVWDLPSGRREHSLYTRAETAAMSADGTRAITGPGYDDAAVWNLASGNLEHKLPGYVRAAAISADGTRAITGAYGSARLWELPSGRCEHELSHDTNRVRAVAISADGTRAITGSGPARTDAQVRWDLESARNRFLSTSRLPQEEEEEPSPDGISAESGDHIARVWDVASGQCERTLPGSVRVVAITPDGTRAITGSDDGNVRVWDLASGHCKNELTGHTGPINSVIISTDGTRAVTSGSGENTIRLWDLVSGQQIDQWNCEWRITSLGASLDLLHIAAGDSSGQIHILDLGSDLADSDFSEAFAAAETSAPDTERRSARPGPPSSKRHRLAGIRHWLAGILRFWPFHRHS